MREIKITLGIAAMSLAILTFQSCGNQGTKSEEIHEHKEELKEVDAYACPMHPEVTGKEGDKCTECGMDLTPINKEDHTGHSH